MEEVIADILVKVILIFLNVLLIFLIYLMPKYMGINILLLLFPVCITLFFIRKNARNKTQNLVNIDKMYDRLGVDVISLHIGQNLIQIADSDQDGQLLNKLAAMRQKLTDDYGYIVPNIRIQDSTELDDNEYAILIRNNTIDTGFVYPEKYMIPADQYQETEPPKGAIEAKDPTYKTKVYWVDDKNKTAFDSVDVIIKHLEEILIQQADYIISEAEIKKRINTTKKDEFISKDNLLNKLTYGDIRQVYANLITERVSVKDTSLLLSKLDDYSRYYKEPDFLSERIRKDLSRQISLYYCNDDKKIYAIDLSQELTNKLLENTKPQKECAKTELKPEKNYEQNFIENVTTKLMKTNKRPILICEDKLRLGLYRLLVKYIPTVVVLSKNEIEHSIELEIIGTLQLQ